VRSQPPLEHRAPFDFRGTYTETEVARLHVGLSPQEMEDKWNVVYEAPWLFFHRSWTGFCIYGVQLAPTATGASIVDSWVNRDASQYRGSTVEHDRAVLRFLIDGLMLGKRVDLPARQGEHLDGLAKALYEHRMVGRIASEATYEWVRTESSPWWQRLLRTFSWSKR